MKHTRLILVSSLFALGTVFAAPAFAQGGGGGGNMQQQTPADWAKARATAIQTQLSLTDADAQKMIAPLTTYRDNMMKAMAAAQGGTPMSADDRTKLADQLKKDLVAAGFTADQADKIATAATAGGRGRRGGGL